MKYFAILIVIIGSFIPFSSIGATLYDYYNTGNDNWQSTFGSEWYAQTFTATSTYEVSSVKLMLDKDGTPITPATVSIKATAGSPELPTGSDLCSGTLDPTTFQLTAGTFEEFTMSAGCELTQGTIYAIIARCVNCTGSGNDFNWNMDYANGTYTGGKAIYSLNSGGSWSVYDDGNTDMLFEVWGTAEATSEPPVAGQFEFPMLLIVMLAVFLICLIIAYVSTKIVNGIDKAYKYKL